MNLNEIPFYQNTENRVKNMLNDIASQKKIICETIRDFLIKELNIEDKYALKFFENDVYTLHRSTFRKCKTINLYLMDKTSPDILDEEPSPRDNNVYLTIGINLYDDNKFIQMLDVVVNSVILGYRGVVQIYSSSVKIFGIIEKMHTKLEMIQDFITNTTTKYVELLKNFDDEFTKYDTLTGKMTDVVREHYDNIINNICYSIYNENKYINILSPTRYADGLEATRAPLKLSNTKGFKIDYNYYIKSVDGLLDCVIRRNFYISR
jgi:hypothetical protein